MISGCRCSPISEGAGTDGLVAESGALVTHGNDADVFGHIASVIERLREGGFLSHLFCAEKASHFRDELWPGGLALEQQMVPALERDETRAGDLGSK